MSHKPFPSNWFVYLCENDVRVDEGKMIKSSIRFNTDIKIRVKKRAKYHFSHKTW